MSDNRIVLKRLFGVFVIMAGCGGGSGSARGPIPLSNFAGALLDAECSRDVRCGLESDATLCHSLYAGGGLFNIGALAGLVPIVSDQSGSNTVAATVAAARAGKANYDAAAARACVDAVAAVDCGAVREGPAALGDVCRNAFTGTVADGQRCISDLECLPGRFCSASATCDGTCVPAGPSCNHDYQCGSGQTCTIGGSLASGMCTTTMPPGAPGEPCGNDFRCQANAYCKLSGTNQTCQAAGQEGQPCDLTIDRYTVCAGGLVCAGDPLVANPGMCVKPAVKGESCQLKGQCGGIVTSLMCDLTQHKCVDWLPGGPCTDGCPPNNYCDNSASPPTCKAPLPLGSACTTESGHPDPCSGGSAFCQRDTTGQTGVCTSANAPTCTP